jgi:hypothetical protein
VLDIEADSPYEAALKTKEVQASRYTPANYYTVYELTDRGMLSGIEHEIDLNDPEVK